MNSATLKTPITFTGRHLALLMGALMYAVENNSEESDRHKDCKGLLDSASQAKEQGDSFVIRDTLTAAIANGAMRSFSIAEYAPNAFISRQARDLYTDGMRYTTMTRKEVDALFHWIKDQIDESRAATKR